LELRLPKLADPIGNRIAVRLPPVARNAGESRPEITLPCRRTTARRVEAASFGIPPATHAGAERRTSHLARRKELNMKAILKKVGEDAKVIDENLTYDFMVTT